MNQDNEETAEVNGINFNLIKFSINSINKLCYLIIYLSELWNAEVKRILAWKINRLEEPDELIEKTHPGPCIRSFRET